MNAGAPEAVFSSWLGAAPTAVWAQLLDRGFIAQYLGIDLGADRHAGPLAAGQVLQARDAAGVPLQLSVTEATPPLALALDLRRSGAAATRLRWTLVPSAGGSRLTVVHEAADDAPADAPTDASTYAPPDAIAAQLALDLPTLLSAPSVTGPAALRAACDYLHSSADAVLALAAALPARGGHARPAAGGFSLAEHLWHLADIEELGWAPRFERVRVERHAQLPGVDGDRLAVERGYAGRPWRGAARRFVAQRRRTLRALAQLPAAALAAPVDFAGRAITVGGLLAAMLAHDREHRLEMAALWTSTKEA